MYPVQSVRDFFIFDQRPIRRRRFDLNAIANHDFLRNASNIYGDISPKSSLSLCAWKKITNWRARHKGSTARKVAASGMYFFNGIFSIVESAIRFPMCYVVGNKVSQWIAKGIGCIKDDDGETVEFYKRVRNACHRSFDQCVQSVAQNMVSTATNLYSHEKNITIGTSVADVMVHKGAGALDVLEEIKPCFFAGVATRSPVLLLYGIRDINQTLQRRTPYE